MTNDTCCAVAMTTVLLLVLSKYKLKFPGFFLNKNHLLYSQNSTEEPWELGLLQAGPSDPLLRVANWDICF